MAQLHLERQQAKNKNFLYIGDKEMIMKKFKMIQLWKTLEENEISLNFYAF